MYSLGIKSQKRINPCNPTKHVLQEYPAKKTKKTKKFSPQPIDNQSKQLFGNPSLNIVNYTPKIK